MALDELQEKIWDSLDIYLEFFWDTYRLLLAQVEINEKLRDSLCIFWSIFWDTSRQIFTLSLINDIVCIYLKCLKYCRQDVDHSGEDSGHRERDGADAKEQGHRRPPGHAQGQARQA